MKRKSLRELKSIVKGKKEELERNLDDIVVICLEWQ